MMTRTERQLWLSQETLCDACQLWSSLPFCPCESNCGGCGEDLINMTDGAHLIEDNEWRCCDCLLVVTRLACDGLTFCEACGQAHGGLPHSRD